MSIFHKFRFAQLSSVAVMLLSATTFSAPDPNFHIYLAFGQSNMEGQGAISDADRTVDARFQVIGAVTCGSKVQGTWAQAVPPLFRCNTKLSPADYFGRTMVEKLSPEIKVGIVPVAVAGSKIELFDKVNYQSYVNTAESWMKPMINEYGGNPYARLVDVAKKAQESGVIKGILLHQGESNTGDAQWPTKVKGVYDNLIADLGLDPSKVPLLAGEVVSAAQGGICAGANDLIKLLPQTIPNSYVISSAGITDTSDNLHFNAAGYRELGKRYAETMLTLLDQEPVGPPTPEMVWLEPECGTLGANWQITTDAQASNGSYTAVKMGLNSEAAAPTGVDDVVLLSFTIDSAQTFHISGRMNAPNGDSDSYWIKIDDGPYTLVNQMTTVGWEWKSWTSQALTQGEHTLTIAYREEGALLDIVSIANSSTLPTGMGNAVSCQAPVSVAKRERSLGYDIGQVRSGFAFSVPQESFVSLKVHRLDGEEIVELARERFPAGQHVVEFMASSLPQGVYFYTMKTEGFSLTRKMGGTAR